MRTLLTVNVGSSSVRLDAFDLDRFDPNTPGRSRLAQVHHDRTVDVQPTSVLAQFVADQDVTTPVAVAHRIVSGGPSMTHTQVVTDLADIERLNEFAPLHNPAMLTWLRAARDVFGPQMPQIAVFDTAFFADLPTVARRYALPPDIAEAHGIRRIGFHGLAHAWMARRWQQLAPDGGETTRLISLQLGGGCSVAASAGVRPLDVSMGYSPVEGLVMATRCGELDPNVVLHLLRSGGMSVEAVDRLLNGGSGLVGMAGSADLREVLQRTDPQARQAVDLYCYRIRKYVGAYFAVLGGADAIVFGGGVGENAAEIRHRTMAGMEWCGIRLDQKANNAATGVEARISAIDSTVQVWVVPVDEGAVLAGEAADLLDQRRGTR
ncbi:MAG: acetate/propionate family kinase [Gemmatimonadota bacterium]